MSSAVETIVLWPRGPATVGATRTEADVWPVFAVIVDIDSTRGAAICHALPELLDMPRAPVDTITNSHCWWSVVDRDQAMLRLAVRVDRPAAVAMDIAVPAQFFLGLTDIIAAGATIGVTTRPHARRLMARTDDRSSLNEIILLGGRTSSELGELAEQLCGTPGRA